MTIGEFGIHIEGPRRREEHTQRHIMKFSDFSILNPKRKRQAQLTWNEFFPYYAGYSDAFASNLLASARLDPRSVILDPWNGSGTTTYAASQMGFPAIGLDLNPVMLIVARSRMLPSSEADTLPPLGDEILRRARNECSECVEGDPLLWWFEKDTADWLRSIELSIRATLLGDLTLTAQGTNFDRISSIAATFYVALFNLAKNLASVFQSSNPTWLRKPKKGEKRVGMKRADISGALQSKIRSMSDALLYKANLVESTPVTTRLCDSTTPFGINNTVDFVLTSPPYCTRIDYTAATRIQLAVLYPMARVSVDDLSRDMIGSTKVSRKHLGINPDWGKACVDFLNNIGKHTSKASGTYYLKTHIDYFDKLSRSMFNISASLKSQAAVIMVIQDSHYKEIHNDVPSFVSDLAKLHGMELKRRDDFEVKTSMSVINRRARAYNKCSKIVESVLCFQKNS